MAAIPGCRGREEVDARRNVLPSFPIGMPHDIRKEISWVDFSNPVNPLGTPKPFLQAMHAAIVDGELAYRPDESCYALRRIMAAYNEIPLESVLVETSPTACIRDIVQALGPARVGAGVPTTVDAELAVINGGAEFVPVKNPYSFVTCKYGLARKTCPDFDAALLANPSYPASRLLSRDVLVEYLEHCRWVVVDESHIDLSLGGESFVPLVKRYRNLVVVRDLSTTFAIPGTPIACIIAHPDTAARIASYTDPAGNGMAAEVLASVFPQLMGYLDETHDFLEREIPWLQYMLSLVPGVRIYPSEGNFVLCRFDGKNMNLGVSSADELSIRLQLAGFLVPQLSRTVGLDGQESYFAVAAQRRADNLALIETLRKTVAR